jgi:CRISPR system Cascade subunit CasA
LIDEPWIPVRDLNGKLVDLGIKDVLLRSRELSAIEDPSPLVVASLHRFLLAVLYRALKGPTDIEHAKRLFRDGFPADEIVDYLEHWRGRFFLFDDKYPFGQIPSFTPKTWRAWTALAAEHNADNAKVLFDHVSVEAPGAIPFANCVRWMLATQTFALSSGKSELAHTGTAPSASALMVLPIGHNLADTLAYALVPQNREIIADDIPIWEREPETVASLKDKIERTASGWADRYTWRARAIRLEPHAQLDGCVSRLALASGVSFEPGTERPDPMLGYRLDEKKGKLALQFRQRGLWRNFDSILPDSTGLAPLVIANAVLLSRLDRRRFPCAVMALGQKNDPPNPTLEFWKMEQFALPEALETDGQIRGAIRRLLDAAEEGGRALDSACFLYCQHLLVRVERTGGLGKQEKDTIREMSRGLGIATRYWSTLEADFHRMLQEYAVESDFDGIHAQWLRHVCEALKSSWATLKTSVSSGNAWAIRALVKAEGRLHQQIAELDKNIRSLEEVT